MLTRLEETLTFDSTHRSAVICQRTRE